MMRVRIWTALRRPLVLLHKHMDNETSQCQHPTSNDVREQLIHDGSGADEISPSAH